MLIGHCGVTFNLHSLTETAHRGRGGGGGGGANEARGGGGGVVNEARGGGGGANKARGGDLAR